MTNAQLLELLHRETRTLSQPFINNQADLDYQLQTQKSAVLNFLEKTRDIANNTQQISPPFTNYQLIENAIKTAFSGSDLYQHNLSKPLLDNFVKEPLEYVKKAADLATQQPAKPSTTLPQAFSGKLPTPATHGAKAIANPATAGDLQETPKQEATKQEATKAKPF